MIRALVLLVLALGTGLGVRAFGETAVYVPPTCPEPRDAASDEVLLRCFAPIFIAAGVEESYNRIGSLVLEQGAFGGLSVHVDVDLPTLYTEVRPDIVGGEMVLQLVYRIHFEKIPFRLSRSFFEAHRNPGLLVVVTLDARKAMPLFVTVAHTCGCYAAVLPTENVPRAAFPPDRSLAAIHVYGVTLPGILGVPSPDARPVLWLNSENHRITDVRFASELPEVPSIPVRLRPMADLRDMPVAGSTDGARASVFHDSWPARGHLRGAWNPLEGLTIFGIVALDPMVGMDKDFGNPEQTGTEFYTMLTPWKQSASRLDRFDRLLRELGFRTDMIW